MNIVHLTGTAWLAHENGRGILIDAGKQPDGKTILGCIRTLGIAVPLLFLTHTHYDHTGGAEAVRRATGAKVMVGKAEVTYLQNGHTPIPAGTGRLGRTMLGLAKALGSTSRDHYRPVTEDIIPITASDQLDGYGSDVWVYHLGAHTEGSIGLKIGDAFFAGDTVFGFGSAVYPPFADRPEELPDAWSAILSSGAKRIYPGHGKPFSVDTLNKQYKSRFAVK